MENVAEKVQTVEKALKILTSFSVEKRCLGITELSRVTGFSKTATYRLVATLESQGFLVKNGESGYSIGPKAFEVGTLYNETDIFVKNVKPVLVSLHNRTNCTSQLCVLDGKEVLVVDSIEGYSIIRVTSHVGTRMPVHSTAAGKVFVAEMSPDERRLFLDDYPFEKNTEKTITDREQFERELDVAKQSGYAVSDEEYTSQLFAMASYVENKTSRGKYTIALLALKSTLTEEQIELMKQELQVAVKRLNQI